MRACFRLSSKMSSSDDEDESTSEGGGKAKTVLKRMITATEALVKDVKDAAKEETSLLENVVDSGMEVIKVTPNLKNFKPFYILKDPRSPIFWRELNFKLRGFKTEESSITHSRKNSQTS